jgi:hypothetical protein
MPKTLDDAADSGSHIWAFGNTFGLEQDLAILSKGSLDQFEQTIVNLICDRIGAGFMSLVTVRFETVEFCLKQGNTSSI